VSSGSLPYHIGEKGRKGERNFVEEKKGIGREGKTWCWLPSDVFSLLSLIDGLQGRKERGKKGEGSLKE